MVPSMKGAEKTQVIGQPSATGRARSPGILRYPDECFILSPSPPSSLRLSLSLPVSSSPSVTFPSFATRRTVRAIFELARSLSP